MSHYNKKCPIDIENYGAIGPSTLSSFLITVDGLFVQSIRIENVFIWFNMGVLEGKIKFNHL